MRVKTTLRRGGMFAVLVLFAVFLFVFVGVVRAAGRNEVTLSLDKTYYFVVRPCEDSTSAAVVGQVLGAGGAGFLMGKGVVVACYYLASDAERVQGLLREQGVETDVLVKSAEGVLLAGERANAAPRIQANAELVDTCARMLFCAANELQRGASSQEEARAAVRGVADAVKGLRMGNTGEVFDAWNAALWHSETACKELAEGILFAKDLRYLQTELISRVLDLDAYF